MGRFSSWQVPTDPGRSPMLFLTATVVFGVLSNAVYEGMKGVLGGKVFAVIATGVILILAILVLHWIYTRLIGPDTFTEPLAPHRGLIVLVSPGAVDQIPATAAIEFHLRGGNGQPGRLQHLYLIAGNRKPGGQLPEPGSSYSNAQVLRDKYTGSVVTCDILEASPDDPDDVKLWCDEARRRVHQVLGLPADEIVSDVTGGTKPMSIGMALSALETGCKVAYLKVNRLLEDGTADRAAGSTPMLIARRLALRSTMRWATSRKPWSCDCDDGVGRMPSGDCRNGGPLNP